MGKRDPITTLYMVNMTTTPSVSTSPSFPTYLYANHVYEKQSKQDLVLFYHAACFSPSKSTFIKAIKNKAFTSWPGLTAELVATYLPKTEATVKVTRSKHQRALITPNLKRRHRSPLPWNHHTTDPSSFYESYWIFQQNLHWSNWPFSCYIQQGVQIYHNRRLSWYIFTPCWM